MGANKPVAIVLALASSILILRAQSFPAKHSAEHSHSRATRKAQDMQTQTALLAEVVENNIHAVQFQEGRVNNYATRTAVAGLETLRRFVDLQLTLLPSIPNTCKTAQNYRRIINAVTVLVSASHLLDAYTNGSSTNLKLTAVSVIVEKLKNDFCQWLSTFNLGLSCSSQEDIIYGMCRWLNLFHTGLDCDNREEFLVTFVTLGLRPSVFQADNSALFGVERDLIISKNWIERTEPVLEHRDFISGFLFPKTMKH